MILQSIKQQYGRTLRASDGNVGRVRDFYFDDQNWVIRYLIADTGVWLPGRQVLVSPYSLGALTHGEKELHVRLTRRQIENSPSIDLRKPVSRQYEEAYYRYFGWPYYWQGDALWGLNGVPILDISTRPPPAALAPKSEEDDPHLRSALAVNGYLLEASDGTTGHVCDFMMDVESWAIRQLVIKTGHRLSGKEVRIPSSCVEKISYEESKVFVKLAGKAVEQSPEHCAATTTGCHAVRDPEIPYFPPLG